MVFAPLGGHFKVALAERRESSSASADAEQQWLSAMGTAVGAFTVLMLSVTTVLELKNCNTCKHAYAHTSAVALAEQDAATFGKCPTSVPN